MQRPAGLAEAVRQAPGLALRGFAMGMADVIPGVSGGTMALVLGIYPRLIAALGGIGSPLLRALVNRDWAAAARHVDLALWVPLLSGIGCALVVFTRVIPLPQLLHTHPEQVYGFFFGLIAGSIVTLLNREPVRCVVDALAVLAGIAAGLVVLTRVPTATPDSAAVLAASGAVAASAMLLPGISGSFVLLILGKYATVLEAVARLDLRLLVPFAAGVLAGLIGFARLVAWLLARWYRPTLLAISGLLVASLWVIWPFQSREFVAVHGSLKLVASHPRWPEALDQSVLAAAALAALGALAVLAVERLAARHGAR